MDYSALSFIGVLLIGCALFFIPFQYGKWLLHLHQNVEILKMLRSSPSEKQLFIITQSLVSWAIPVLIIMSSYLYSGWLAFIVILWFTIIGTYLGKQELARKAMEADCKAQEAARKADENMRKQLWGVIHLHIRALVRKYNRTHQIDDYGLTIEDTGKWNDEVHYFISNVLCLGESDHYYPWSVEAVRIAVEEDIKNAPQEDERDVESLDPIEFEQYCAEVLSRHGWNARSTQGSGDQGIDVIAEKNGQRVVIQCKLYSKPVGNGAVQEIIAGKAFEAADIACVVSNQPYTKSAQQLAAATGVRLLSHRDLPQLGDLIKAQVTVS